MTVLEAVDLAKVYLGGDGATITVLDGIHLEVERGEMVAIVGASGAGKSTLLHLLGALDKPTRGLVRIGGQEFTGRTDEELSALRNRSVGFVFQFHHLLREFTALENVMMPLRIAGWDDQRAAVRAEELLGRVGLGGRMMHRLAGTAAKHQALEQRVAGEAIRAVHTGASDLASRIQTAQRRPAIEVRSDAAHEVVRRRADRESIGRQIEPGPATEAGDDREPRPHIGGRQVRQGQEDAAGARGLGNDRPGRKARQHTPADAENARRSQRTLPAAGHPARRRPPLRS